MREPLNLETHQSVFPKGNPFPQKRPPFRCPRNDHKSKHGRNTKGSHSLFYFMQRTEQKSVRETLQFRCIPLNIPYGDPACENFKGGRAAIPSLGRSFTDRLFPRLQR